MQLPDKLVEGYGNVAVKFRRGQQPLGKTEATVLKTPQINYPRSHGIREPTAHKAAEHVC